MAHSCAGHAVTADLTVEDVTHRGASTLSVLKQIGINHCCGAQLTLREAAASAGVPIDTLLKALNEAPAEPFERASKPAFLETLPESRRVDLDVREDSRRGEEPFARIMTAVWGLREGDVLVLRAPFEPIPLYDVLGKRGFGHSTDRHGAGDWSVWFYREPGAAGRTPERTSSERRQPDRATDSLRIDVRGLEPPQPMVRVLELVDTLEPGQRLEVLHDRRPLFLYPQLDAQGFVHETEELGPGLVRIIIRRRI